MTRLLLCFLTIVFGTGAHAHPANELSVALRVGNEGVVESQATFSAEVLASLGVTPHVNAAGDEAFTGAQVEFLSRFLQEGLRLSRGGDDCSVARAYGFDETLRPPNGYVFKTKYACPEESAPLRVTATYFRGKESGFTTNLFVSSAASSVVSRFPRGDGDVFIGLDSLAGSLGQYAMLGFEHIVTGYDHLLFLLVLIFSTFFGRGPSGDGGTPLSFWRANVAKISAFTLAHGLVLMYTLLCKIDVPGVIVEPSIALSISVAAAMPFLHRRRSLRGQGHVGAGFVFAFLVGLVHGLGFAGSIADIGVPEQHFFGSIAAFNVGIELGQMLFLALVFCSLVLVRRFLPRAFELRKVSGAILLASFCISLLWVYERVAEFAGT